MCVDLVCHALVELRQEAAIVDNVNARHVCRVYVEVTREPLGARADLDLHLGLIA
jgi:hypothetical protein